VVQERRRALPHSHTSTLPHLHTSKITRFHTSTLYQIAYKWLPFLPWSRRLKVKFVKLIGVWTSVWAHVRARAPYPDDDPSVPAGLWRVWAHHGQEERHVIAHTSVFVVAGHETTAGALAWALYDVACNPGVQVWQSGNRQIVTDS
jgi:cytochrome P450